MKNCKIIRTHELAELLGISISQLYKMINNGELPPRVQISSRANGWRESDIDEWIEERTESAEVAVHE